MTMTSWRSPRADIIQVARKYLKRDVKMVYEIGVYKCGSLMALAQEFKDARIVGVDTLRGLSDLQDVMTFWASFLKEPEAKRVELHICEGITPMLDMEGVKWDLIHIDGDHDYDQCRAEFVVSKLRVNPGGLVLLDDMHDPNVKRVFDSISDGEKWHEGYYGVWRAPE